MNKRKRKNPLKPFPLTRKFPKTVKVPGAWAWRKIDGEINKKTYTEEEIQLQQEEDRILKGWKTIKDPDARELGGTYKALELIRNYLNVLKVVYGIDRMPYIPYFKDLYAVVAHVMNTGKYRPFYSIFGVWYQICHRHGDPCEKVKERDLLEGYPRLLRKIKEKDTTYVVQRCMNYWKRDNSLTREQRETLSKEYAQALYDWAREECYMTFQPKSIPETQAHLAKLLEDNKDYIEGKRIKGVN